MYIFASLTELLGNKRASFTLSLPGSESDFSAWKSLNHRNHLPFKANILGWIQWQFLLMEKGVVLLIPLSCGRHLMASFMLLLGVLVWWQNCTPLTKIVPVGISRYVQQDPSHWLWRLETRSHSCPLRAASQCSKMVPPLGHVWVGSEMCEFGSKFNILHKF